MNDTTAYFVKIRGRTIGPFTSDRLRQMAQQGQLSRVNMISPDGNQWQRAGDLPQLFDGQGGQRMADKNSNSGGAAIETLELKEAETHQAKAEWHYAIGTEQRGPVTFGQLRGLIQNGSVGAGDLVWKDGMADWEPIAAMPELAASLPRYATQQDRTKTRPGKRTRDTRSDGDDDLMETKRVVRASNPWVFFICIAMYVMAAFIFMASIAGIVTGARVQSGVIVAQAVINMLVGGILITGSIFLNRYSSFAGQFVSTNQPADLNNSLRWLGRFWLFVSIILIFSLTLTLISVIYLIAIGTDLANYSPY